MCFPKEALLIIKRSKNCSAFFSFSSLIRKNMESVSTLQSDYCKTARTDSCKLATPVMGFQPGLWSSKQRNYIFLLEAWGRKLQGNKSHAEHKKKGWNGQKTPSWHTVNFLWKVITVAYFDRWEKRSLPRDEGLLGRARGGRGAGHPNGIGTREHLELLPDHSSTTDPRDCGRGNRCARSLSQRGFHLVIVLAYFCH